MPRRDFRVVRDKFANDAGLPFGRILTNLDKDSLAWSKAESLKVVAKASVSTRSFAGFMSGVAGYEKTWVAINARDYPMVFQMVPETGDPASANLKISPQLLGSFTHTTTVGAYTHAFIQMEMAVAVNGVPVTGDTLYGEWEYQEDADGTRALEFPKGLANVMMVPNVPANSQISVMLWVYSRVYSSMDGSVKSDANVTTFSPYGRGTVMVVVAEPLGVTAVDDRPRLPTLSLAARPNPTAGATRIAYTLPRAGDVRLAIYDIAGHRVATLVDGFQEAGQREMTWSPSQTGGHALSAGVYLVELIAGSERRVGKLVLTR